MIRLCKAAGVPAPQFRQDGGQFVQTLRRPTGGDGARFVRPESGLESRLHRQVVLTIPKRLRPYCLRSGPPDGGSRRPLRHRARTRAGRRHGYVKARLRWAEQDADTEVGR